MNFLINIVAIIYGTFVTIDNLRYLLVDDYVRVYDPISIFVIIMLWSIYDNTKK